MCTVKPHQWSDIIKSKDFHMRLSIKSRTLTIFAATATLVLAMLSACASGPTSAPVVNTVAPEPVGGSQSEVNTAVPETVGGSASEIVIYASDLPLDALDELDFIDDAAAPGGKLIGLPNNGDELDPPPENDPHATFNVQVQSGVPYRCWIHMKVGTPKGRSTANVVWVQFSDSVNQANQEVFRPATNSYLTAQGPGQEGWTWVGCDAAGSGASESLVYFQTSGEVAVRLQAGAEGVGFDQIILSPAKFLNGPPSEPIVEK